jgi:hypothetical protein
MRAPNRNLASCGECNRLTDLLNMAARGYARATEVLAAKMGLVGENDYNIARAEVEEARLRAGARPRSTHSPPGGSSRLAMFSLTARLSAKRISWSLIFNNRTVSVCRGSHSYGCAT